MAWEGSVILAGDECPGVGWVFCCLVTCSPWYLTVSEPNGCGSDYSIERLGAGWLAGEWLAGWLLRSAVVSCLIPNELKQWTTYPWSIFSNVIGPYSDHITSSYVESLGPYWSIDSSVPQAYDPLLLSVNTLVPPTHYLWWSAGESNNHLFQIISLTCWPLHYTSSTAYLRKAIGWRVLWWARRIR